MKRGWKITIKAIIAALTAILGALGINAAQ